MLMMWVWLAVSLFLCSVSADTNDFRVWGPGEPVLASPGASVVLPCTFSPVLSTEELEVRWHRSEGFNMPFLLYKDMKIQEIPVDPQYRDRVSLTGSLEEGNVSLKLKNVTLSDRGEYECYVSNGKWYETGSVLLRVKVLGSVPVLSVTETGGEQVNVSCVSDGWSPQPTVTWRDREGRELKMKSTNRFSTNSDDLVSVSSWLLFSPSESEWISCSVSLSDQEKREGRVLPLRIPQDNSGVWKAAFIVTVFLSLLIITVVIVLLLKKGFIPHKKSKRNPDVADASELIVRETGAVVMSLLSEETAPPKDWNDMKEMKEHLTFDVKTAPQCLKVTENNKRVTFTRSNSSTENKANERFPHVLCEQNFSSGKHYWEVKVYDKELFRGHKESWYVGVARGNAERMQRVPLTPLYGYWVLHYEKDKGLYENSDEKAVVSKKCGSVLGVFLDCDENTVSFYDVDTESHLYTFSNVVSGMYSLVPVISPGVKDTNPLTLC